ncbi:MAG: alpha/beta fold hydrolase [Desulfobulbaceae bacterium]|nr:alpha/beta fold hydrolase [Desulfobulbaceae bacterium]HIJ78620.1 alpha/beta fold hydrolase [Deltaproteobacteria bacterium]
MMAIKQKNKRWVVPEDCGARPVVFLPGWGFDGRVLALAAQDLPWIYPVSPLDPAETAAALSGLLDDHGLERVHLVGWSMGAQQALDFAVAYPARVESLSLLAMRTTWPSAEIAEIRREMAGGLAAFFKGFYRKCFLGEKKTYAAFVEKLQESMLASLDPDLLARGLDYLEQWRLAGLPPCPISIWHGGRDIVAPSEQMIKIPGAGVNIITHGSHPIFLDRAFNPWPDQRKARIRHRFSKAAETYDAHAQVQGELAALLAEQLPAGIKPARILEIGSGTGSFTAALVRAYPAARITCVDFAENMLQVARAKLPDGLDYICEDGERFLAACRGGYDLICSNATIQWFDDIGKAFADISAGLSAQGLFVGAIFGPETLHELGGGLAEIFATEYTLPASRFPDRARLEAVLGRCFNKVEIQEQRLVREYDTLLALLDHIRKTGTGGGQRLPGSLTRGRIRELENWFMEKYGAYRLTYQAFVIRGGQ